MILFSISKKFEQNPYGSAGSVEYFKEKLQLVVSWLTKYSETRGYRNLEGKIFFSISRKFEQNPYGSAESVEVFT